MKNLVLILSIWVLVEGSQIGDKVKKSQVRKAGHRIKAKHRSKDIFFSNVDSVKPRNDLRLKKTGSVINVVKRTQKFLDEQATASQEGESIYQSNKKGRDERMPDDEMIVAQGEVYARIKQKDAFEDNLSTFGKIQFKLNHKMLYFLNTADDLRGVAFGVNLADIVTSKDNINKLDCCARIEPQVRHVEIPLYQFKGYCFRIEMKTQEFLMCDDNLDNVAKLKKQIEIQVMKHWWSNNNLNTPFPLIVGDSPSCIHQPFSWVISAQTKWPCICSKIESKEQSPIQIDNNLVEFLPDTDTLNINFEKSYSLRYAKVVGEPEFYSTELGSFTFITREDEVKYIINKFTFKIKEAEHKIINIDLDAESGPPKTLIGELQLYADSSDGKRAVLAITMAIGENENEFVKNLNPAGASFVEDTDPRDIKKRCVKGINDPNPTLFDLKSFMKSNKKLDQEIYFYKYQGSYSKPPCSEGVTWFVMKHPAFISQSQFELLKNNYLQNAQVLPNNVRVTQPLYDRKVFFQQGAYSCKDQQPVAPALPDGDYKYIHAQQQFTAYALADRDAQDKIETVFKSYASQSNPNIINLGRDVKIAKLDNSQGQAPQQIPRQTMENLIKKYHKAKGLDITDRDNFGATYS